MMDIVRNEKGIALVLALVMLILLTILGTFALSTSSTEMFISGNYRNMQRALYAADSGADYGTRDGRIYNNIKNNFWPPAGTGNGSTTDTNRVVISSLNTDVKVQFIKKGAFPIGMPPTGEDFAAGYYLITSSGLGPGNARVDVESFTIRPINK